jgi:hypothetical protein
MHRWLVALIFLATSVANGLTSLPEVDWRGPVPTVAADAEESALAASEVAVRPARSHAERFRSFIPLWGLPRTQIVRLAAPPCVRAVVASAAEIAIPDDRLSSADVGPRGPPSA